MDRNALDHAWTWILLVAIGVLGGVGDVWIYRWARSDRPVWLGVSCLAHGASVVLFGLLLKWDGRAFGSAFLLTSVVHVVLVVAADLLALGGRPNAVEWVGMVLAAIAILMLETGRADEPIEPPPPIPIPADPNPEGDCP